MGRRSLKNIRQEEIARALYRCLLKKPFSKTTIKDIAKEAGVNHGMLHYYFKSKEEILLYFLDWVVAIQLSGFRQWYKSRHVDNLPFEKALTLVLNYTTKKITLNEDLAKLFIEIWEIALYNKTVKKKLQYVYHAWIDQLTIIIGKETNEKIATLLSVATIAFLEGMSLFSIMLRGKYPINTIIDYFEKRIETIIKMNITEM
ncbi:MAG TPA: TetR/AcrR family transcriptional regulator [Spirochaetota bacterium]|nr:TetR/AcrR family transcriptional regulator [Spirochaetota bacterium]